MAGLCLGHEGVAKVGDIDYFSFFKFLLFFFFFDWSGLGTGVCCFGLFTRCDSYSWMDLDVLKGQLRARYVNRVFYVYRNEAQIICLTSSVTIDPLLSDLNHNLEFSKGHITSSYL